MPRKATGRPPGRPKVNREAPEFGDPTRLLWLMVAGHEPPAVPLWWSVMAEYEAEWRAAGKWRRGSAKDLARHTEDAARRILSPSSVSAARRDPRYRAHVERRMRDHQRILAQDKKDHGAKRAELRARIRPALEATHDTIKARGHVKRERDPT